MLFEMVGNSEKLLYTFFSFVVKMYFLNKNPNFFFPYTFKFALGISFSPTLSFIAHHLNNILKSQILDISNYICSITIEKKVNKLTISETNIFS